jgi:hypothetical protein
VRLDDPAASDPARWMQVVLEAMVSSVGLPGPWPDGPPPQTSELQDELGKGLASHAPASAQALRRTVQDPVRVPCHGDATPPNVLVDPGQLRAWLLGYEFHGPGDPCLTASGRHRVPLDPTGCSSSAHSWPCGDGTNREAGRASCPANLYPACPSGWGKGKDRADFRIPCSTSSGSRIRSAPACVRSATPGTV